MKNLFSYAHKEKCPREDPGASIQGGFTSGRRRGQRPPSGHKDRNTGGRAAVTNKCTLISGAKAFHRQNPEAAMSHAHAPPGDQRGTLTRAGVFPDARTLLPAAPESAAAWRAPAVPPSWPDATPGASEKAGKGEDSPPPLVGEGWREGCAHPRPADVRSPPPRPPPTRGGGEDCLHHLTLMRDSSRP